MYLVESSFIKANDIIIDCRYNMTQANYGPQAYQESHLKGAYYINLDQDMTDTISLHGGRHPLKDLHAFTDKIGSFGILDQRIVIYDDGDLPMAARLWFMLRLIGLKDVYILKGGYKQACLDGYEVTSELPKLHKSQLKLNYQEDLIVDMNNIIEATDNDKIAIVDSRANERYLGLEEPFDKIAGRIPSAINYFWKDNFIESDPLKGLKSYGDIQAFFLEMDSYDQIYVHCGSGITGCVNMLMMEEVGIKSKLYLGSYSDWISYDDHEIIVKNNEKRKVKI